MADDDENSLTPQEFSRVWNASFEQVVEEAVTLDRLRARRIVLEGRVAQASVDSIRWTKIGVFVALVSSGASLILGAINLVQ